MKKKSYDPKCFDLAAAFLADEAEINTEVNQHELAYCIQIAIEEWIADTKRPPRCNHWPGQVRCEVCGMGLNRVTATPSGD